jgi:hypothetical protein
MKRNLIIIAALAALALVATACEFSFSTANISDAYMSTSQDGTDRVTTYPQDAVFYAIAILANAPDDTELSASWYAVNAADTEPNFLITEASTSGTDGQYYFSLTNEEGMIWPIGTYRVDLFLNGELNQSLNFSVQ